MLNTTVVCIDHISGEDQRKGRSGASKPYGSVFKWNSARNAFELVDATGDDGVTKVILRHRKANLGPKMSEATISVQWSDEGDIVRFKRMTTNTPTFTLHERIVDALETGPCSYRQLLDLLNNDTAYDVVNESDVRAASRGLLGAGQISIDHAGVLRIMQPEVQRKDPDTVPLDLDAEPTPE